MLQVRSDLTWDRRDVIKNKRGPRQSSQSTPRPTDRPTDSAPHWLPSASAYKGKGALVSTLPVLVCVIGSVDAKHQRELAAVEVEAEAALLISRGRGRGEEEGAGHSRWFSSVEKWHLAFKMPR